jgi:methylenetetrahydrofolate reductase (NADPH)
VKDAYLPGSPRLTFEIFPPKSPEALAQLYGTVGELCAHHPLFISVTYGAGGSTREQSLEIADAIRRRFQVPVTAHFTCVGSTLAQVRDWLGQAERRGIENIMALRGDPPQGQARFQPTPGGLRYASELVALIKEEFPRFGVGVAGYPETHQEALSPEADLENLKRKVDSGGDVVYTQLFYDNADFLRFRQRCQAIGIRVPIVPGLLPVLSLKQIQRITTLCKARLPDDLVAGLQRYEHDPAGQTNVGIEHCIRQCEGLIQAGVPGIHFYVLNRSDTVRRILAALGMVPRRPFR